MVAGFSRSTKNRKISTLESNAEKILREANGVIEIAQARFFQSQIESLRTSDPEMYTKIEHHNELMKQGRIEYIGHQKLVEMTWDTMAAYLPVLGQNMEVSTSSKVEKKMKLIAKAACTRKASETRILDVGCGDGAIFPFLIKAGASKAGYLGLDISSKMVEAARSAHPDGRFEHGGFLDSLLTSSSAPPGYDTVLFNGALQFFSDTPAALRRATGCLRPGGRILLAHANGAGFVAAERRGSPATVVADMPTLPELEGLARDLGATVVPPDQLGWKDPAGLDAFYLAGLDLGPA
jgi:SAM-dependent methyltransferase